VATAANRSRLAGVDLSRIYMPRARFVGFPADLEDTHFDDASLQNTRFELADLNGAQFPAPTPSTPSSSTPA
jgi:uncharacterized protein YjbI with pentapeptide repeats